MSITKEDKTLFLILYLTIMLGSVIIALLIPTQIFYFWFVWIIGVIFFILYNKQIKENNINE